MLKKSIKVQSIIIFKQRLYIIGFFIIFTFVLVNYFNNIKIYNGYDVRQVMNITDVGHLTDDGDAGEDKMEKGAAREQKTAWEIAEFYTKAFQDNLASLNILPILSVSVSSLVFILTLGLKLEES